MGVEFRSYGTGEVDGGTDIVATAPSGILDNDILLAWSVNGIAQVTWTLPTDFTELFDFTVNNGSMAMGWKRASSESGDYTFVMSTTSDGMAAVSAYSDCL